MTLLNTANDGLPSVLIALTKVVSREKKLSREKLLGLVAPESVTDGKQARQTLNTWEELGLFQRNGNDIISFCEDFRASRGKGDLLSRLRSFSRKLTLTPQNNPDLWATEKARSADFTRALTWCLAQDVYKLPGGKYEKLAEFEADQFHGDSRAIQNGTRWNGFKMWAVFFGFGWLSKYPNARTKTLVVDPTVPVCEFLPRIFEGGQELPHNIFLDRLATRLPVADGGGLREEMESVIEGSNWQPPKNHEVSTSLSRALERLHIENEIKLEDRADASKVTLLGRGGRDLRKVSHIVWLKG